MSQNGRAPAVPDGIKLTVIGEDLIDCTRRLSRQRFDATPGTAYLLRPDQHLCARWRSFAREDRGGARRALVRS